MSVRPTLQVTYLWKGRVMGYRLFGPRGMVTLGARKGVSFVTPQLSGFPARFRLLTPVRDGFRLRVGPGIKGDLLLRGESRTVGDILTQPAVSRFLRPAGMFRETELYPGDSATLEIDGDGPLRFQISFTDPPEHVPRSPVVKDPLFFKARVGSAAGLAILLAVLWVIGDRMPNPKIEITSERFAKVVAPVLESPQVKVAQEKEKTAVAERQRKRQERESAESKRAREKEGRIGRNDATSKETVLPRAREDVLRAKVAKTGILAVLGTSRPAGSGLGRLLDTNNRNDMEGALNGLAGAKLVAGRGDGGLGVAGTGLGGGGTGFGRIQGSGDLDVGAGRGRGRRGPPIGTGRAKEMKVGMQTGTPDAEGGLTREQVNRVVQAHAAAIRYCYEKELQRQPSLAGKIVVFWVIRPNGAVDRTKIAESNMGSRAVEGCIERQVKNWQFPRSDAETIVQTYPFFFKGGGA